jgi:CHAD domain-containing protein
LIPPSPWLDTLRANLAPATASTASDAIHEVRVAAARLDVWLRLAGRDVLRDDLGWLRRTAGAVRDIDVILAHLPPEPWQAWLRKRRQREQTFWKRALESPRAAGIPPALASLPPLALDDAREGIRRLHKKVRRRGEKAERRPEDDEALHAFRRAVRRLRYAEEWIGRDPEALKRLHGAFGRMNDAAVALRVLDEYPGSDQLAAHRKELETLLAERRAGALAAWEAEKKTILEDPR